MSDSFPPHGLYPTRHLCQWDFSGKNTKVGCHFLLQGIFQTQGQTCVSCISCIASRLFITESQGENFLSKKMKVIKMQHSSIFIGVTIVNNKDKLLMLLNCGVGGDS